MLGEIIGGVFGSLSGERIRRAYFGRKLKRARSGGTVRVRIRTHPVGAPYWRYWRGPLVWEHGSLRFRPRFRWWRATDLTEAKVIGVHVKESAADGDRTIFTLVGVARFDHLAVSLDGAPVVEAVFDERP